MSGCAVILLVCGARLVQPVLDSHRAQSVEVGDVDLVFSRDDRVLLVLLAVFRVDVLDVAFLDPADCSESPEIVIGDALEAPESERVSEFRVISEVFELFEILMKHRQRGMHVVRRFMAPGEAALSKPVEGLTGFDLVRGSAGARRVFAVAVSPSHGIRIS